MADDEKTYTEEEVQAQIKEALAEAKSENDKAFSELWDEAKEAKRKLRDYDGVDPEEYRKLQKKVRDLEQEANAKEKGVSADKLKEIRDEISQEIGKRYESELGELKETLDNIRSENRTLKLDNRVKAQMGKAGVRSERLDALWKLTQDHYDLTEDGEPIVKVRPGKEVEAYIAEDLVKEYPEFFNGSGSSGGGASKSARGAGGAARTVAFGDDAAFAANIDKIIDGDVEVEMG